MPRPQRADARRNRERILAVATKAFATIGLDASLEAIAKEAGVGIGTLYRHFPSRESLVEAAYRNELGKLCDAVPELLAELRGDAAMRAWMDRYVEYMATKRGMADALRAVIAAGGDPYAESRDRLLHAIEALSFASSGYLRDDVAAEDVLAGLSGITLVAGEPERREQATRLLDLLMDGLRVRPDTEG